uniref:Integrase catalytic domain-containing protein n=1 Tax=Fagus sylvatica TaxID=28930 RepID=A0A2N9EW67_FAGSY
MGLRGSTRVWFNKLESKSIGSFVQLSRAFIKGQRKGRLPTHLLSVKQMEGESLTAYVHRFNKEAMQIDCPKEDVTQTAFMAGLRKGDFLYDICKDSPETLSELMYKAQKHINVEDALEALNDPPPKRRKEVEDCKQEPTKQKVSKFFETPECKRTTTLTGKFNSFTPLNTPIDKLLMQIQDDPSLRWPGKIRSDPNSRPKNLYCRFHRDHGHLTEDCVALKEQVETLIRQRKLQKYVSRPNNARPPKPQGPKELTENPKPRIAEEIRTIVGGPAVGGISRTSRKAYTCQVHNIFVVQRTPKNIRLVDQIISFSEEDARGKHQPHDDALIITLNINDFTTRRVMIDNGSSANILYLHAYQQMKLDKEKLRPMGAPLVGFTVEFLVVDCPSAYNAIIEQPTLNRLLAVTSTYHFLLKFPTEHGIGEVRGDQIAAKECYNQIVMDEANQEKTSFITSRGLFYYKIGKNVKVYIDDMLVKSNTLRKYQMKLNPSKYAFGVSSGKFLGFMVSQRGIKANPDKIKAILEMQPPRNIKETQGLTERIAALNRFVSRSTDKCLPFFKVLRKAFEWTDDSTLLREEEGQQLPVYYTSRALRGAEERYPPMEKLAFALVTAARKLRPYFQAHTIILLTNHPLRKAMNKPDAAGRLIQWSIELSEFDIDYRPRTAIKAQALADYIAEFTTKDDEPKEDNEQTSRWTAYIDRSSTKNVGGIGIILKSPEGRTIRNYNKKNIQNFIWKAVICRFGIPRVLVSDNGKQFNNPRFRQFSQELGIHNHYSSPGHPQANGQVEVTNRSLLKLIKSRLEGAKGLCPEELPSILWAYRTTVKIPTGETPFRMTYESEVVVPVKIGLTTLRTSTYDDQQNEEQLRLNLVLIDEVREMAETRMKRYQKNMACHYNAKVKPRQFFIGDLVL